MKIIMGSISFPNIPPGYFNLVNSWLQINIKFIAKVEGVTLFDWTHVASTHGFQLNCTRGDGVP
jgi:hypothetical protein